MRPITVTVGPLAATSVNNIATSQSPAAKGFLALNGTLGTAVANSIALSQSVSGATAVIINGSTAQTLPQTGATGALVGNAAFGLSPQRIYITSAGNDSGITFAVVGFGLNSTVQTETITGANAGVAVSLNRYVAVISITTSGSTASTITVGSFGSATLDKPRQVLITTGSAISFTITGTNWAGDPISETVTNSGASVASVLSYATVISIANSAAGTSITVGTNGVADSPWVRLDEWALGPTSIQANVTGTVNYTVFMTNDDPNSPTIPPLPSAMVWQSGSSPFVGATASGQGTLSAPFLWAKVTLNSETAATSSVTATFAQMGSVTY